MRGRSKLSRVIYLLLTFILALSALTLVRLIHIEPVQATTAKVYVAPADATDLALTPEPTVVLRPDGDGAWFDWTDWGGGNYDDWDEADPHDGDSTYVWVAEDFAVQSSTLDDPPANTWAIAGVRVTIVARTTDPLSNDKVFPVVVTGAMSWDYWGFPYTPTTEYRKYTSEWAVNPDTELNWTWSDITSLEAGAGTEQFGPSMSEIRVTQVYVEVFGPRLTVDINIANVTDLWLYQFELLYNPDILQGVYFNPMYPAHRPVDIGPFITKEPGTSTLRKLIPGVWNNTRGRLSPTGAWLQTSDPSKLPDGNGTLATVYFWVVGKGETEITLGDDTGLEGTSGPIPSTVAHGYFSNVALNQIPTASFTTAAVDTPEPLRGYNVDFTSTSTPSVGSGSPIATSKWYFWRDYEERLLLDGISRFPHVRLKPNGDGTCTGWTNNWDDWDDITPDQDATYVSANAPNLNETSSLEDYTAETWPISQIRVTAIARQTGDERLRHMLVVGGTRYIHPTPHDPSSTYTSYTSEWEENPATASPWTWSDINALEVGVTSEQFGGTWFGELRVTQLYVEVAYPASIVDDAPTLYRSYRTKGTYNVTLTVTDSAGVSGTTTGYVTIKSHDIFFLALETNATRGEYPTGPRAEIDSVVEVNATAINQGDYSETFDVSTFSSFFYGGEYHRSILGTQTGVNLLPGANTTRTFYWDTTGQNLTHPDTVEVHANASRVPYEWDTEMASGKIADNEFIGEGHRIRFHDMAVTNVALNATSVTVGQWVEIEVTVENEGDFNETSVDVTAYYDATVIGTQTVSLFANNTYGVPPRFPSHNYTTTLTFLWDTTGVPADDYTISAKTVPWIAGDCDRDGDIDALDLYLLGKAYHPGYNADCDFNGDLKVDDADLLMLVENYETMYDYEPEDNVLIDGVVHVELPS